MRIGQMTDEGMALLSALDSLSPDSLNYIVDIGVEEPEEVLVLEVPPDRAIDVYVRAIELNPDNCRLDIPFNIDAFKKNIKKQFTLKEFLAYEHEDSNEN